MSGAQEQVGAGMSMKRTLAGVTLMAIALIVAGCMLLPGKFVSDLSIRRDGTFDFTYRGEIYLLALSKLAADEKARSGSGDAESFTPSPCYSDSSGEERDCSKNEIADQKQVWEEDRAARKSATADKKKSDEQMMKAMLGGIDPADPRAAAEFAERLRRQRGWKSVIDKGDGRFEVEYTVAGRLDHDFTFPTVEKMQAITPFVTVIRRADGTVRIDAPSFMANAAGSPFMGMAAAAAQEKSAKGGGDGMPQLDGVFTLVTDGEILANNTDEGPVAAPGGKRLQWKVNARTSSAPTALVKLGS